ncbi:hypothetical protein I5H01_gp007 [Mycobacterium phage MarkPhew]|uniref:Uncharacterized protein n=1 Tax=Mycobacterium phage MarkPhew TaxID=2725625 RepID=A0A6M3SYU7_9CAUD|nr:hypothetical protein I5H01_gp007 [Mycobacterium phage MarkPhew]QJD50400.1 hypothetical protein SEA_MARKPHEW_100 [Mycobacterium phage MarkPhew]
MITTAAQADRFAAYAASAARDYLASMDHYGDTYVPVGDGRVSSPGYCENKLRKAFHMIGATSLPAGAWRGAQWRAFAEQILAGA